MLTWRHLTSLSIKLLAQLVKPGMFKNVVEADSHFWVFNQKLEDEIHAVATVVLPLRGVKHDLVLASHADRLFLRVVVEG